MLIGYAPVLTDDLDLSIQRAALKGCRRAFEEKVSGAKHERSTKDLFDIAELLNNEGAIAWQDVGGHHLALPSAPPSA